MLIDHNGSIDAKKREENRTICPVAPHLMEVVCTNRAVSALLSSDKTCSGQSKAVVPKAQFPRSFQKGDMQGVKHFLNNTKMLFAFSLC